MDKNKRTFSGKRYSYFNRKTAFGIYRAREKKWPDFQGGKMLFALFKVCFT
jgi:hypothetical protein